MLLHFHSFPTRRSSDLNPDVILADEPIASLDPVTSKMVMDDFKRINQETNMSVLLNIHHVEVALEYADRIIDRKSTRLNSSHVAISYAVFCLIKKSK